MKRQEEIKELKEEYFKLINKFTPEKIKGNQIFDLNNPGEIKFVLTKQVIDDLKLNDWLKNYEKEAKVSIAGIRGAQNVVFPWDSRFPINEMGVALATISKALVSKEDNPEKSLHKIAAGEVRYNTELYVELISRIQAGMGITTHVPFGKKTIPVWMVSFMILMLGYDGGEFVTSSHAISSKIATKDLENQGSQFLPDMSLRFIQKIKEIFEYAKTHPEGYVITLAPKNSEFIKEDFDGYDAYIEYLKKNVAKQNNLEIIKKAKDQGFKIMYDTVGGCMGRSMPPILERLGLLDVFEWRNKEEDPFFHGVGKAWRENPKTGKKEFFDYSCDFCLIDVVKNANFEDDLQDKPIGYVVLVTDPDGDRLNIGQIESADKSSFLDDLGLEYIKINNEKIFIVYNPTYSFFLIMDYYTKQLKKDGILQNHPRFIVATAPSSKCWNEWAKKNNIAVVTTPVGMKEIAAVVKKTEKQILTDINKDVVLENAFGENINLGKDPRMIFGGEESGGMITGVEDFIQTNTGRKIFAMREKSAGESSIIATTLAAYLFLEKKTISEYLLEMFKEYNVKSTKYVRDDIIYYNESEPDPDKLLKEKLDGEVKRDMTDTFYLAMALAYRDGKITMAQIRELIKEALPELNVEELLELKFPCDATHFDFTGNMFVQIRRSGTDAKMRGYAGGADKARCVFTLKQLLNYSGERTELYKKTVPQEYQGDIYPLSQEIYKKYFYKDL